MRVHLGVEDDFRPARKAHPALVVADLRDVRRARSGSTSRGPTTSPAIVRVPRRRSVRQPHRARSTAAWRRDEADPLPGDRRRAARAGVGERGRLAAAERVGAVGAVRRQPGHRAPGPGAGPRRGADRRPPGVRVVRRHRAGAPAPRAPRHDRGPARGRRAPRRAAGDRVRLRRPARAGAARSSASTRCCASSGSTSPTASRSPSSRCGARPSSGASLSREDVERRPFYELLGDPAARRHADDRRRLRRARRRRAAARPRRRAAAALPAGHDRHHRPAGADERAPVPGPPHRVRRRAARSPNPRLSPAGLRLVE